MAETASVAGGGPSVSPLAAGADKLNDTLVPDFCSGFESPKAKPPDAVVVAVLMVLEPKGVAVLPPNLKSATEF